MWPTIVVTERPTIGHINPLDLDALHGDVTGLILISFDDKHIMIVETDQPQANSYLLTFAFKPSNWKWKKQIKKFLSLILLKSIFQFVSSF